VRPPKDMEQGDAYLIYPYRINPIEPLLSDASSLRRMIVRIDDIVVNNIVKRRLVVYASKASIIEGLSSVPVSLHPTISHVLDNALYDIPPMMADHLRESLLKRSWRNGSQRHHLDLLYSMSYKSPVTSLARVDDKEPWLLAIPEYERRVPITTSFDWWSWDTVDYALDRFSFVYGGVRHSKDDGSVEWSTFQQWVSSLEYERSEVDSWLLASVPRQCLDTPPVGGIPLTQEWARSFPCLAMMTTELRAWMDFNPIQFVESELWDIILRPRPSGVHTDLIRRNLSRLNRENVRLSILPYLRYLYHVNGFEFRENHCPDEEAGDGYLYPVFGQHPSVRVKSIDGFKSPAENVRVLLSVICGHMGDLLFEYGLWDDWIEFSKYVLKDKLGIEADPMKQLPMLALNLASSASSAPAFGGASSSSSSTSSMPASSGPFGNWTVDMSAFDDAPSSSSLFGSSFSVPAFGGASSSSSSSSSSSLFGSSFSEPAFGGASSSSSSSSNASSSSSIFDSSFSEPAFGGASSSSSSSSNASSSVLGSSSSMPAFSAKPIDLTGSSSPTKSSSPPLSLSNPSDKDLLPLPDDRTEVKFQPSDLVLVLENEFREPQIYSLMTKEKDYTLERFIVMPIALTTIAAMSPERKVDSKEIVKDINTPIVVPGPKSGRILLAISTPSSTEYSDVDKLAKIFGKMKPDSALQRNEMWVCVLANGSSAFVVSTDNLDKPGAKKLYSLGVLALSRRFGLKEVKAFDTLGEGTWQVALGYFGSTAFKVRK